MLKSYSIGEAVPVAFSSVEEVLPVVLPVDVIEGPLPLELVVLVPLGTAALQPEINVIPNVVPIKHTAYFNFLV